MFAQILRLTLLIFSSAVVYAQTQGVILGVLEDHAGVYAGDPNFRAVRVVFEKAGKSWQVPASTKSAGRMIWTIGFDGKPLGQVTGRAKESEYLSEVGLQNVVGERSIPTVGKRSADYGGFVGAPVYRPLIANSRPFFGDPDKWKPTQPSIGLVSALRSQFRKRFPTVDNCSNPEENVAKLWSYRDENIKVLKVYASKRGWRLAQLQLEDYRCDGPADVEFADHWYVIDPAGQLTFLDQEMWLVDAGDYDNDGKSELVFSIDRYNRGGYELFYDDFKKHVVFEFGYH